MRNVLHTCKNMFLPERARKSVAGFGAESTRRSAFTLVELLVVIGIIALLIGILVPTLAKARESSIRVKCLSNLRELGTALQAYGSAHNGRIPIGYWSGQKQSNFMIHVNENDGIIPPGSFYTMLGCLYYEKLMQSPQYLYCPAEPLDRYQFNTKENPWPPPEALVASGNQNTRCGYGTRPVVNWLETGAWPEQLPIITKMGSKALVADIAATPYFLNRRHRKGINVYYANGSAKWVDKSAFESVIKNIPNIGLDSVVAPFSPNYNDNMLREDGSTNDLWHKLDRE